MISIPSTTQVKQQDKNIRFIGNPEITFFKSVFNRHTNFAIESFNIPFKNGTTMYSDTNKTLVCEVPKFGDLLGKVFLRLSVPPMKTTNEYKFKFNDNFGLSIIENIKFKINGNLIENLDAKILHILYTLHHTDEEQKHLKQLINGTIHDNIYLDANETSSLHSKTYINKYYNSPIRTENEILYVPLDFAFTHFYNAYLPLFLLDNKAIEIEITLRAFDDMFTIEVFEKDYWYYDKDSAHYNATDNPSTSALLRSNALDNTDMSETSITSTSNTMLYGEQTSVSGSIISNYPYYLKRYESRKRIRRRATDPTINSFTYNSAVPFSLEPSLQVEQIFLTNEEKKIILNENNEILIQQVHKKSFLNIKGNQTHTIVVENHSNLIKEFVFVVERNDNASRNQFLNFTNYEHAELNEDSIRKYQDNWWFDASGNESFSSTININGGTKSFTITNDKFQDFLFKYGPYGEAAHGNNDGGTNWTSNKIQPQYSTYTIEEIDEFRKIWEYRDISNNIPIINSSNFTSTFSENPLLEIDMLFDGSSREDIKESSYYNKVQPYLYHTNDADPGVYVYSFSIDPEEYQPSGFCNMNLFRKAQYKFKLNQTELTPEHITDSTNVYDYNISIYSLKYNFVTIKNKVCVPLYSLTQ